MTIRLILVMIYSIFTWMWGLLQKVESNFISTNLLLVFVFLIFLVTVFIMLKLGRVLSSECGKHGWQKTGIGSGLGLVDSDYFNK